MGAAAARQNVRAFSVRVPETLYQEASQIAERRNLSINALVGEALTKIVSQAQDQEMYEAATLLGLDAEMSSVDFAFGAQAEVALTNE